MISPGCSVPVDRAEAIEKAKKGHAYRGREKVVNQPEEIGRAQHEVSLSSLQLGPAVAAAADVFHHDDSNVCLTNDIHSETDAQSSPSAPHKMHFVKNSNEGNHKIHSATARIRCQVYMITSRSMLFLTREMSRRRQIET